MENWAMHPFASLPFSTGIRMCIGRRIAEMILCILIAKILKEFRVENHHGDIGFLSQRGIIASISTLLMVHELGNYAVLRLCDRLCPLLTHNCWWSLRRDITCTARFLVWHDDLMIDFLSPLGLILSSGGMLHGTLFRCTYPSRFLR
ncbi:hypothetical protein MTO96_023171 [Rhipicephalus appendiculatus]